MTAAAATDDVRAARPGLILAVALLLGAALTVAGVLALQAGHAQPVRSAPPDPVERLQALIVREPDNTAARLQLGHAYFAQDSYDLALEQYLAVLSTHPDNAQALARSGWIAFEGGDSAVAERLLARSLELLPSDPEALWYLAQVRVHGAGDPRGAVEPLRTLLARDDLDPGLRKQVKQLLATARS